MALKRRNALAVHVRDDDDAKVRPTLQHNVVCTVGCSY
jgi:hypothetical protein